MNIKWIKDDTQLQMLALTGTTTSVRIVEYNAIDMHDVVQGISTADMMQAIAWDCVKDFRSIARERRTTACAAEDKAERVISDADKASEMGLLDPAMQAAAEKARAALVRARETYSNCTNYIIACDTYIDTFPRPDFTAATEQERFFVALLSYVLTGRMNKALLQALTTVVSAATDYRIAVVRDNQPATRTGFSADRVQTTRTALRSALNHLQEYIAPSGDDTWLVPRKVTYRAYELDNVADALAPVQAYQRDGVYRLGIVRGKAATFSRTLVRIVIGKRQNQSFTIG